MEIIFTSNDNRQKEGFVIEWKFMEGTFKHRFLLNFFIKSMNGMQPIICETNTKVFI